MPASLQQLKLELGRKLSGRVVDQDDPEYRAALQIDNGRISLEPGLIVIPDAPPPIAGETGPAMLETRIGHLIADVVHTVKTCRKHKVKITVKSGGHGASGYCLNDGGVVLDLKHLDWIRLDGAQGRLYAGVGQRFRRIYDFLEMSGTGLVPVGGGCPTVGLGGFLLGGGYSFLSRTYGLGADNVTRFVIVMGDGTLRDVGIHSKSKEDKELFWGLCGGGGGNFGVVVGAELQCHKPHADSLLVGNILFPFHRIREVLEFYNRWVTKLPNEMAVYGYLGSQADPRMPGDQPLMLRFSPVFNGEFKAGVEHLRDLLALAPVSTSLYNMTIHEWEDFISSGTEVKGRGGYMRSVLLPEGGMTPEVAKVFMFYMNRRPSPDSFVVWTHAGGAIADVEPDGTSFYHRKALFVPEVKAIWRGDRPEDMRPNVEWAWEFFNALAPHATGAYLNYIDPLQPDWKQNYYGGNIDRLLVLKTEVDPDNFFSFHQSIESKFNPDLASRPLDLSPLSSSGT